MATKKKSPKKAAKPVKKKAPTKASTKKAAPKKKSPVKTKKAPPKKTSILKSKWVRGGLLALVLLVFGAGLFALTFQVWRAPTLAKYLPSGSTIAFVEGDLELWLTLQDFLSEEEIESDGVAWIASKDGHYGSASYVYEDHQWQTESTVRVYEPLKKDENYIKMRPNLPYHPLVFAYLEPSALWDVLGAPRLKQIYPVVATKLDLFSDAFPWFPAMGVSIDYLVDSAVVQTYTVGDKSLLDGEALFHLNEKYQGELINYFSESVPTYVGGQNLATTFEQIETVLSAANDQASLLNLQDKFEYYFGEEMVLAETLTPLFENEYALAVTPQEEKSTWILAIQLTEETSQIVEDLKDKFLSRGLLKVDKEAETLSQIQLTVKEKSHEGLAYSTIQLEDLSDYLHFFVFEDVLFLSFDRTETEQALKTLSDNESARLEIPDEIIRFSDHVLVANSKEGYRVSSGINLFDDGLSTLHIIK